MTMTITGLTVHMEDGAEDTEEDTEEDTGVTEEDIEEDIKEDIKDIKEDIKEDTKDPARRNAMSASSQGAGQISILLRNANRHMRSSANRPSIQQTARLHRSISRTSSLNSRG